MTFVQIECFGQQKKIVQIEFVQIEDRTIRGIPVTVFTSLGNGRHEE